MKILLLITIALSVATLKNMYTFGYDVSDAFWRVVWAIDEGTIWAENFSEENFDRIKTGMTSNEVLSLLGEPLNSLERCEAECYWYYTKQDAGTSDFDQRLVVLNQSKKVIEIRKGFFID